jgi:crotonobetainyl-CoA:carnitine CoA-transferase CaiB-like acyl-CoA transferase
VFEGRAGVDFDPYWYLEPYALLGKARRTVRPPWSVGGVATGTRAEAPWLGEQTESVARELLGMSDGELAEAVVRGTMG